MLGHHRLRHSFREIVDPDGLPSGVFDQCVQLSGSIVAVIGLDNARHKLVADHVLRGEVVEADPLDPVKDALGIRGLEVCPARQVDLRPVAGDDHAAAAAKARQEHLHLHRRGVLRFIQNDEGIGAAPPARCPP